MRNLLPILSAPLLALLLTACASSETIDADTAEGAFELAEKYEKDERFEEAINYYTDVKNKHPYSRFATESELKIGDIEYQRENYVEAESAYKLFKEYHPDHPKNDYVTLRAAMSVYNQLPSSVDRDLALASSAIDLFNDVIEQYPKSKYVKEAKEYKQKSMQMLADKTYYIAHFYFKREIWESSLGRFEDLMRNHPGLGYDTKALHGATISAYKMKDMDKAKAYFKRLLVEHPESDELKSARGELQDGF